MKGCCGQFWLSPHRLLMGLQSYRQHLAYSGRQCSPILRDRKIHSTMSSPLNHWLCHQSALFRHSHTSDCYLTECSRSSNVDKIVNDNHVHMPLDFTFKGHTMHRNDDVIVACKCIQFQGHTDFRVSKVNCANT